MIKINNLVKNYKLRKEKICVLNHINLEIYKGEFISILGQSGCGKTTLLNIIGGLEDDIEGEIYYENKNITQFREKDRITYRKQKVGYIFQNFNLISHLSVQDNVELPMKFNGRKEKYRKTRALFLLKMVGLEDKAKYMPSQLSGGQKQRVAIARALANEPDILLADEPTGALDTEHSREIMKILKKINQENGVTIIFVTHNKELAKQADRIVYMKDGSINQIVENQNKDINWTKQKELTSLKAEKMSLLSAMQEGMKNIIQKKKRNILAVFGMAVGVTGMTLMLGIGIGAEAKINYELRAFVGDETIWVTPSDAASSMTQDDISKLKKIEGVESVLDNNLFMSTYYYENNSAEGMMDAFGPKAEITEYERSLANIGVIPKDDTSYEIVLTSEVAKQLAGEHTENLIGKEISIITRLILNNRLTYEVETLFTVVGINDTGLVAGSSFIPYHVAAELANQSCRLEVAEQKGAEVRAAKSADYDGVVTAIHELGYTVATNKEDFSNINSLIMAGKLFLFFVSAAALFISGIMIKIVLHTNVLERTKEIGIMGAIGASKKDIKRIFVMEAGILGIFSGITGVLCGTCLGKVINMVIENKLNNMSFRLYQMNGNTIIICIALSTVIAMFSGMRPAKKAAKIAPAEALRYE